jgi:hypothetical protein
MLKWTFNITRRLLRFLCDLHWLRVDKLHTSIISYWICSCICDTFVEFRAKYTCLPWEEARAPVAFIRFLTGLPIQARYHTKMEEEKSTAYQVPTDRCHGAWIVVKPPRSARTAESSYTARIQIKSKRDTVLKTILRPWRSGSSFVTVVFILSRFFSFVLSYTSWLAMCMRAPLYIPWEQKNLRFQKADCLTESYSVTVA